VRYTFEDYLKERIEEWIQDLLLSKQQSEEKNKITCRVIDEMKSVLME